MPRSLLTSPRHHRTPMNLSLTLKDIIPLLPLLRVSSASLKPARSTNSKSSRIPLTSASGWQLWTTSKSPVAARLLSKIIINLLLGQHPQQPTWTQYPLALCSLTPTSTLLVFGFSFLLYTPRLVPGWLVIQMVYLRYFLFMLFNCLCWYIVYSYYLLLFCIMMA